MTLYRRVPALLSTVSVLVAGLLLVRAPGEAVVAPMPMGSGMASSAPMSMPGPQVDPAVAAQIQAAKTPYAGTTWSIFNHRGAGFFIFLWGLTALFVGLQWPRRTWWRFVPPLTLVGLVEFLILRNDPMAWPLGPIGFWLSNQSTEVFQHRVFILLIAAMAIVELLRAADRLPPLLAKFALPSLAAVGAFMILFHMHGGAAIQLAMQPLSGSMPGPSSGGMEASMAKIKHEHTWFAILGFGFVVSRLLADTGRLPGRVAGVLWPLFAIAVGVYMFGYTE